MIGLVFYYSQALNVHSTSTRGVIDLSETDFDKKGVLALNGEWEFYWNQFLEPERFPQAEDEVNYALVPSNWDRDLAGNTYHTTGFATYRLVIQNIPADTKYFGLLKGNIRNASRIFVNGEVVLTDGEVSKNIANYVSGNNSQAVYFELESSTAEIIIHASNYDFIVGGIAKPISFGTQKQLMELHQQKIMFEFSMILLVVIIGLFYLFLFLVNKEYRRKEPATLPLACSCLFYGIMSSIYSERIITVVFPALSMDGTFRFGHLISAFTVISVLFVIHRVSPLFLSERIKNFMLVFYGIFIVVILLFPLTIYSKILVFYMIFTVCFYFIIWLKVLFFYIRKNTAEINKVEHITMIISICSVYLFWFDMILYSVGLKMDMLISFLTIPVYSITFSVLLIVRYTHSYKQNEELSTQLIETFSTLDQTVKKAERSELAFLQAQIKPHFLFNTLSSIISLCYTDGKRAAEVLSNLSNYLKRSFQIDIYTDYVTIDQEIQLIKAYVDIEKVRFGDRVRMIYTIDEEILSSEIIPLVIEPLVENAIRHGVLKSKSGGEVKLTIKKQGTGIYISVKDNGKGIDDYQIRAIRAGERNLQSMSGNGISLANIYTRLQNFYQVELQFESDSTGTHVYFVVPFDHMKEETVDDSRCNSGR
ncbi:hypothetical protein DV702_00030 [Sporosarcina sp. PTS2304]|uniref:histidine kinase n=1 Tax=Sporosarcina sp. PTS2304 TaxID=2283194 RepID=UPI000E0D28D3|nr:histidine kinase [Sporosarcina sp. PTS2304]AXH98225.1 hypothetical protein DV702_00030 [Sporosarcina sp. PTS2304]